MLGHVDTLGIVTAALELDGGLTTRERLVGAGFNVRTLQRWVGAGHLLEVQPDVFALRGTPLDRRQRLRAAVATNGPSAVASHLSAAHLWDLHLPPRLRDEASSAPSTSRSSVVRDIGARVSGGTARCGSPTRMSW